MDIEKAIKQRRSVRKYEHRDVPEDLIKEIIDAARLAPSSHNVQPWKFFVIKDGKVKDKLKENNVFKHSFVFDASLIIVCCADPALSVKPSEKVFSDLDMAGKAGRDLAFASQNLVLRATELGLGTCYIGMVDRAKIKKFLDIPDEYVLPYVILVGYPAEKPNPTLRKKINDILVIK